MSIFEVGQERLEFDGVFHPDQMPVNTLVTEMTLDELHQPSGITDTYRRHSDLTDITIVLSNLQVIELFEKAGQGSQGVYIQRVVGTDKYGVYSKRPSELQAKELAKLRDEAGIDPDQTVHSYSWRPETYY